MYRNRNKSNNYKWLRIREANLTQIALENGYIKPKTKSRILTHNLFEMISRENEINKFIIY